MKLVHLVQAVPQHAGAQAREDQLRDLLAAYARGQRVEKIAVVGNAPLRPDAARAAFVDDSDLVVRMTTFALDEPATAEPAYGRRTDVVVLHRGVTVSPHTFAAYTSRLYLLAEPGRTYWEQEVLPDWWPADLGFVPISNRAFAHPLSRLLGLDPREATWATTGTLTVYLLLRLFESAKIRVAGFSIADEPDQAVFRHAWGEDVDVTPEHRLAAESALLRLWHAEGRIELVP